MGAPTAACENIMTIDAKWNECVQLVVEDPSAAEQMITDDPGILERPGFWGETPLHYLLVENYIDCGRWLISKGANVNATADGQRTPLMDCAQVGHDEAVKLLLEAGADPKAMDENDESALHVAAFGERSTILKLLVEFGGDLDLRVDPYDETPREIMQHYSWREFVRLVVVDRSAAQQRLADDPGLLDRSGPSWNTPLAHALAMKDMDGARWLIKRGANVDATNEDGATPLMQVVLAGHLEAVDLLLQSGADPNVITNAETSAMHYATAPEDAKILDLLLQFGGNLDLRRHPDEWTPRELMSDD